MHVKYEILRGGQWTEVDQLSFFAHLWLGDGVFCRAFSWLGKKIIWFSKLEALFKIPPRSHVETVVSNGASPRTMSAGPGGLVPEFLHRYFGRHAKRQYIEIVRPVLTDVQRERTPDILGAMSAEDEYYEVGNIFGFIKRVVRKFLRLKPGKAKPRKHSAKANICSESRVRYLKRVGADVMPDGEIADHVSPGEAQVYEMNAGATVVARVTVD